jgi:hypothetical protein
VQLDGSEIRAEYPDLLEGPILSPVVRRGIVAHDNLLQLLNANFPTRPASICDLPLYARRLIDRQVRWKRNFF